MSGHFRHHPDEYEAAITEILGKAVAIYRHKNRIIVEEEKLGIEGTRDEITNRFSELRKAATTTTSFQGFAVAPSENLSPSSMEYYDGKNVGSVTDERKGSFIHLPSRPSINANGVLGQILFDVCVPKTVEDWDVRSNSKNTGLLSGTRRHAPFNPIKCIRRSRL
jgi:farnesol dehydrogenase